MTLSSYWFLLSFILLASPVEAKKPEKQLPDLQKRVQNAKAKLQAGGPISQEFLAKWNGNNVYNQPIQIISSDQSAIADQFASRKADYSTLRATPLAKIDRKDSSTPFNVVVIPNITDSELAILVPHEITHIESQLLLGTTLKQNPKVSQRYFKAQQSLAKGDLVEFQKTHPEDAVNILKLYFCEEWRAFQNELKLSREGLPLQPLGLVSNAQKVGSTRSVGEVIFETYIQRYQLKKVKWDIKALENLCRDHKDQGQLVVHLFSDTPSITSEKAKTGLSGRD